MFLAAVVCRWKSMFTYLVPGADFLSCFAFTRCLTELFMDLFQFGQVQITKDKLDVECVDSLLEPDHHILNSPLAGMPTPIVTVRDIKKTKPPIHQLTNLKCCKKSREPFKTTF